LFRWIESTTLPELSTLLIIAHKSHSISFGYMSSDKSWYEIMYFDTDTNLAVISSVENPSDVTHWMSLPKPPTGNLDGWISVDSNLPGLNLPVIVLVPNHKQPVQGGCFENQNGFQLDINFDVNQGRLIHRPNVTHWRHLPDLEPVESNMFPS
jgi:hypothetical protein